MATQIQKTTSGTAKLAAVLKADSVQEQFRNALGEHKDAFVASIIDLYNGDKALQTCNTNQLVCEALKAAVLKLPLNKALGFAYIVVYNTSKKDDHGQWVKVPTPTFVIGYKGLIQLAMRTGQYKTINADCVYEGELRKVDRLTGEIALDGERKSDKVVGYFAHIELVNGFRKTLYMSVSEMAKYAKRYSPSVSAKTSVDQLIAMAQSAETGKRVGWEGNFGDMAVKTVVRRLLSKYGYLSIEMQEAVASEITHEAKASRDELIAESAGRDELPVDAAFEEVKDEEPAKPADADAAKSPAEPGY